MFQWFTEIYKRDHNSVLFLVGDGELKNDLKREVELLNLASNIKFLGIRQDVKNLMFMSDVLLFPSFYEGLPVVLVEAQATGLKAVISNTISKEIDITPNIERIDISKSPSQYAELALKKASEISISDRNKAYLKVREAGYDIANTVKMLEEIYSVEY